MILGNANMPLFYKSLGGRNFIEELEVNLQKVSIKRHENFVEEVFSMSALAAFF